MGSLHERFWEHDSFVVIGDSAEKGFPLLTYQGLKDLGKKVIPVDLGGEMIGGESEVHKIENLPTFIEAAVVELPREKTAGIIKKVASIGIRDIWIHQGTETPMAMATARSNNLRVVHGSCAVMYVNCTSYHKIHRWIWRLIGKY